MRHTDVRKEARRVICMVSYAGESSEEYYIEPVLTALDVLDLLLCPGQPAGAADVAPHLGMSRNAAFCPSTSLRSRGRVSHDDDSRRYRRRLAHLLLGNAVPELTDTRRFACFPWSSCWMPIEKLPTLCSYRVIRYCTSRGLEVPTRCALLPTLAPAIRCTAPRSGSRSCPICLWKQFERRSGQLLPASWRRTELWTTSHYWLSSSRPASLGVQSTEQGGVRVSAAS